jgi:hypothetical protein
LRTAAGWSSGAMVSRYTAGVRGEVAMVEFHRAWTSVVRPSVVKHE